MKKYDSITIHYWMVSQLKLTGLELLIYAALFDVTRYNSIELSYLDEIRLWAEKITGQTIEFSKIEDAMISLSDKDFIYLYEDSFGISHLPLRGFGIKGKEEN